MFLTEFDAEEYAQIVAEVNERRGREQGREEGLKQGREQGLKQGREQGREQGLKQGLKQGREEAALANIRSLMANLSLTALQAFDALGIPEQDRPRYEALLADEP